jgi:hypothetical protein
MKLAADDTLDADTFAAAVDVVVQRYRHVLPTGTFQSQWQAPDPYELSRVLCLPRPTPVAAAAVPARPALAKQAKGKGSSGVPVPPVMQPAAARPPAGPNRRMCEQGADCLLYASLSSGTRATSAGPGCSATVAATTRPTNTNSS